MKCPVCGGILELRSVRYAALAQDGTIDWEHEEGDHEDVVCRSCNRAFAHSHDEERTGEALILGEYLGLMHYDFIGEGPSGETTR
jgi:hypothetical protein